MVHTGQAQQALQLEDGGQARLNNTNQLPQA
jgi:hypothetical protein